MQDLVRAVLRDHRKEKIISLLAISVSHLEKQAVIQMDLPLGLADERRRPGSGKGAARLRADRAVDKIRGRFGWEAVGYASVALGEGARSVPDAFRELAAALSGGPIEAPAFGFPHTVLFHLIRRPERRPH